MLQFKLVVAVTCCLFGFAYPTAFAEQPRTNNTRSNASDPNEWNNIADRTDMQGVIVDHRQHIPKTSAPEGPSYYNGTALIRITGDIFDWKRKEQVDNDPDYVNAAKVKSKAWTAAAKHARRD